MGQQTGARASMVRGLVVAVAVVILGAGCGADSGESEPSSLGSDASLNATGDDGDFEAAPDDDADTDTDTDGTGEEESDGGAELGEYSLDPVPDTNSGEAVAALVEEIHGSTDDLSREVNRLTRFPRIPTPAGANLFEVEISTGKIFGDDRTSHSVTLEVSVADQPQQVQAAFEEALTGDGWSLDSTEFDPESRIEESHERRTFSRPIDGGTPESLTVTSIETDAADLVLSYRVTVVDEALHGRFQGIPGDGAPVPAGAEFLGSFIATSYGPGETGLAVLTEHDYEDAPDPSVEGILAEIEALAAEGPYPVEFASVSGVDLTVDGYDLFQVSPFNGLVKVKGERTFPTPEPGETSTPVAAPDQSADPLADGAGPEAFAALLADIHGPTSDVSAQMQRLGPFPQLPTPRQASILNVESTLSVDLEGRDVVVVQGAVELAVAGQFDEVDTFYQAQLVASGWVLARTDEGGDDPEVAKVTHSYTNPDVVGSIGAPLEVEIVDDPANADVQVTIDYNEFVPADQADWGPWSGWVGDAPIPDGGERVLMGVNSFRWDGDAASLLTYHVYPGLERDEVLPAVEAASPGTDYTRNPDLDRTGFGDLDYTHPSFERVGIVVASWGADPALRLEARFTYDD